jgi:hypothetical protein
MKRFDAFISHASEDKIPFVRDLAYSLKRRGYEIWYDDFSLKVGDSLRKAIDHGLSTSRFGIVILSSNFFRKGWANYELGGIVALDVGSGGTILPVWLNVDKSDVLSYSPLLSNIKAIIAKDSDIESTADQLSEVLGVRLYDCEGDGTIRLEKDAKPLPEILRSSGFQSIRSVQVDRIVDKIRTQSRSDITMFPLSEDFSQHPFHFWQSTKGDIELIRSTVYDAATGEIIESDTEIEYNDGFKFVSRQRLSLVNMRPIRVVQEIRTTNQLQDLFDGGIEYVEFNNKYPIRLFEYSLVVPNSVDFRLIELYANEEKLEPLVRAGERIFKYYVRDLKPGTELRFTFVNRGILPDYSSGTGAEGDR